uniref:Uncharacterized protein n=1 Tax=Tanacetum cinerariifolium TaxID=118510 RepID=A0A699IL70_TANCI|nr:hypothetical protein [Tanacetum cinerariifolium]
MVTLPLLMVACCRGLDEFLSWLFVGGYRENDMVIHIEKTGMMRLVVEIWCAGKIADVFDKATWSFDGLRPEKVDLKRKSVQELRVHLKLFQLHVVDIHIIEEQ